MYWHSSKNYRMKWPRDNNTEWQRPQSLSIAIFTARLSAVLSMLVFHVFGAIVERNLEYSTWEEIFYAVSSTEAYFPRCLFTRNGSASCSWLSRSESLWTVRHAQACARKILTVLVALIAPVHLRFMHRLLVAGHRICVLDLWCLTVLD